MTCSTKLISILKKYDDKSLIFGRLPNGFKEIQPRTIVDKSRWSYSLTKVIGTTDEPIKYFRVNWSEGATEYQYVDDYYIQIKEVFPKEVTVTIYE